MAQIVFERKMTNSKEIFFFFLSSVTDEATPITMGLIVPILRLVYDRQFLQEMSKSCMMSLSFTVCISSFDLANGKKETPHKHIYADISFARLPLDFDYICQVTFRMLPKFPSHGFLPRFGMDELPDRVSKAELMQSESLLFGVCVYHRFSCLFAWPTQ